MWKRTIPLLAAAFLLQGCLVKETTHTLYLEEDGTLTWTVLEHAIRSDANRSEF